MGRSVPAGEAALPRLLDAHSVGKRQVRQYVQYLHRWRRHLCHLWWRAVPDEDPNHVALAVDDLISLALLLAFVRQYDAKAIPLPVDSISRTEALTTAQLFRLAAGSTGDPLLIRIFQPFSAPPDCVVPRAVLATRWLDRISGATWRAYAARIPLTVFGEFHQLSLGLRVDPGPGGEKPTSERRTKGAHYTPAPIVDYLTYRTLTAACGNTQGPTITDKTILDPSCGCGAFLVASLRYVLASLVPGTLVSKTGRVEVTPQHRLDLLEKMIFGTDLDMRAAEWTRRSLLLAVWDSCMAEGIGCTMTGLRVPSLQANIATADFLAESHHPLRPDIVIGGPPFVRLSHLHKTQADRIPEYRRRFEVARKGQFDLYMLFFEKAIHLLRGSGSLGFSVSSSFLRSASGRSLRRFISSHAQVQEIVEFADNNIYPGATTQIALMLLRKGREKSTTRHVLVKGHGQLRRKLDCLLLPRLNDNEVIQAQVLSAGSFSSENWRFAEDNGCVDSTALRSTEQSLGQLPVEVRMGLSTGADEVFLLRSVSHVYSGRMLVRRQCAGGTFEIEAAALRPILRGRDIHSYAFPVTTTVCVFPYDKDFKPLTQDEFREQCPLAYEYLANHRRNLEKRQSMSTSDWHLFRSRPSVRVASSPKIVGAGINEGKGFTLDFNRSLLCANSVLIVCSDSDEFSCYYLLGVLNSRLVAEFMEKTGPDLGAGRTVYRVAGIKQFPLVGASSAQSADLCEKIAATAKRLMHETLSAQRRRALRSDVDQAVREVYLSVGRPR